MAKIQLYSLKPGDIFKFDLNDKYECYVKFKDEESIYYGVSPNPYRPLGGCCNLYITVHIEPYGYNQLTLF